MDQLCCLLYGAHCVMKHDTALHQLRDEKVKFRTLGLSATPGSSKEAIQVRFSSSTQHARESLCITRFHIPASGPCIAGLPKSCVQSIGTDFLTAGSHH